MNNCKRCNKDTPNKSYCSKECFYERNEKPKYKAKIKVLGRFHEANGRSIKDAISNIKIDGVPWGVSVLIIYNGDESREKILTPVQTRNLFNPSPTIRNVVLKQVSEYFNI